MAVVVFCWVFFFLQNVLPSENKLLLLLLFIHVYLLKLLMNK